METQPYDLADGPVALASGPDTAYYNIRPTDRDFKPVSQELDMALQEELEALKVQAQKLDEPVPTRWAFEGQTLMMHDKGGSQFKWMLKNEKITLMVGRGKKTGIIGQVRLSSDYLWSCSGGEMGGDLGLALSHLCAFLPLLYGEYILLDQSSLDLAVDILFLDMDEPQIKEYFISRAVLDEERPVYIDDGFVDGPSSIQRRWKKLSGLSFGVHTSVVSAVIYNKTDEIKYHSPEKKWFHVIWRRRAEALGIEYNEKMKVWRVEVRFKRTAFREFPDVSNAFEVLEHVRDLWAYGVGHPGGGDDGLPDGWLRYVVPSEGDTNRSRWLVHPSWEVIQSAFIPEPLPESPFEQEQREREELLALVDAELEARPLPVSDKKPTRRRRPAPASTIADTPTPEPEDTPIFDLRPFIRKSKREVNMEKASDQLLGWLATIEAWRRGYAQDAESGSVDVADVDISVTLHFAQEVMIDRMEEKKAEFSKLVHKKQVKYFLKEVMA